MRSLAAAVATVTLAVAPARAVESGGTFYLGPGVFGAAVPDLGPGVGASFNLQLEIGPTLTAVQFLLGGPHFYPTLALTGQFSWVLTEGEHALYAGGQLGIAGTGVFSDNVNSGMAVGGQAGLLLFRSNNAGQIALELQGLLPLSDRIGPSYSVDRRTGHRPFALLALRFLL